MKNHCLWAVLLLGLASCTAQTAKQTEAVENPIFFGITESVADSGTRVFADSQLRVLWNSDDRISIFDHYTFNKEYRFSGETGDNSGSFSYVDQGSFITGNDLDYNYAVYPYREDTRINNDGIISYTLPSTQPYYEGSFGPGANSMVSVSESLDLRFKNLCGYLSFKLYGSDLSVSSISLRGNEGEPLAGRATVISSVDSFPSLSFGTEGVEQVIELTFDTPVALGTSAEDATSFWLVVPPTVFHSGFTLTVMTQRGAFQKRTTKSLEIQRNHRTSMSSLQVVVTSAGLQVYEVLDEGWDWGD